MSEIGQIVVAYTIVALAALYALWRFVPGLKPRLAALIGRLLQHSGLISASHADQIVTKLSARSGCGSCDSCGACDPKKTAPRH